MQQQSEKVTYNNGNGTLTADANGALSVDGVTVSVNDRVLVKDQSSSVQNGIYKVTKLVALLLSSY